MASQLNKASNGPWRGREKSASPNRIKSVKRMKSPKKSQVQNPEGTPTIFHQPHPRGRSSVKECKKSANDMKIEDVFLNSKYFKHYSGNKSTLSFCSKDDVENQWTIDQWKLSTPARQKLLRSTSPPNQSDTVVSTEVGTDSSQEKLKASSEKNSFGTGKAQEETQTMLEEILTEKGRTDRDLVSLITDQMFLAEKELQITRMHLVDTTSKLNERDLEIIRLHEKIRLLEKTGKPEMLKPNGKEVKEYSSKTSEDYQRLIVASEKLKKQVKDMEEFLNDYGLVWVGETNQNKETNLKPDFDKIIKSFQRLNTVACQPKIIQTTMGARFKLPREVPLVFYSNGLLLRDEFREYNTTSTTLFLQDVEDGYFPGELQAKFPDGVPFEVVDKRSEVYNPNRKAQFFEGQGNRLGSMLEGKNLSMVYLTPIKQSKTTESIPNLGHPSSHKSQIKKLQKKRSRYETPPEELTRNDNPHCLPTPIDSLAEDKSQGKMLKIKIRFGSEKTNSFVLEMPENGKMFSFQKALHRKLCEKFHDECIVNVPNTRLTDFELHIYGKPPFRLSDHLERHLKECDIVDNCVINATEI